MAGIINTPAKPLPSKEELAQMNWDKLYQLRTANDGNLEAQKLIAPYEHQAYAREAVAEKPWEAPVWAVLPIGYQAYKALGGGEHDGMTTPASLDQAVAGMKGVGQGLVDAVKKILDIKN